VLLILYSSSLSTNYVISSSILSKQFSEQLMMHSNHDHSIFLIQRVSNDSYSPSRILWLLSWMYLSVSIVETNWVIVATTLDAEWEPETSLYDLMEHTLTYQHTTYAQAVKKAMSKSLAN
jgi:hypothetical protein